MIDGLKPYPEYKETDSTWLGVIPTHWEEVPLGRVLVQRIEQNRPIKTREILSLSLRQGVIPYSEKKSGGNKAKSDLSAYTLAYPGDIVLNSMNVVVGSVGLSKYYGAVSPVYYVLRTRKNIDLIQYFDAIFQDKSFQQSLWGLGNGIMFLQSKTTGKFNTIRLRIPMSKLRKVVVPLPPPDEQEAIVKFLDYANGKIERAIRAKRKLIGLLNEQKQAIIHRAVTRGLDPNVKLKPSDIPWLGDVPKHWEVRPIKNWAKINVRTLSQSTNPNYKFRYIDIGSVRTGYLVKEPELMQFAKAPSRARRILRPGDTIVSTVRTYLKAVWFAGLEVKDLIASTGFAVFSPNDELQPEYLHYILQDSSFVNQVTANSIGIAYPAIAETVMARFHVPIPPSRAEQQAAINAIKLELKPVAELITRLQYEIDLLCEYRTTLTAEVVTGKLDVREATKRLPDQADEPLPFDDSIDELIEDEIDQEDDA